MVDRDLDWSEGSDRKYRQPDHYRNYDECDGHLWEETLKRDKPKKSDHDQEGDDIGGVNPFAGEGKGGFTTKARHLDLAARWLLRFFDAVSRFSTALGQTFVEILRLTYHHFAGAAVSQRQRMVMGSDWGISRTSAV